jgi:hypothetical protein
MVSSKRDRPAGPACRRRPAPRGDRHEQALHGHLGAGYEPFDQEVSGRIGNARIRSPAVAGSSASLTRMTPWLAAIARQASPRRGTPRVGGGDHVVRRHHRETRVGERANAKRSRITTCHASRRRPREARLCRKPRASRRGRRDRDALVVDGENRVEQVGARSDATMARPPGPRHQGHHDGPVTHRLGQRLTMLRSPRRRRRPKCAAAARKSGAR